jgi:hypothetical protein
MKTFKSHSVLKLHMRKKKHFRIDPHQTLYDRFYIVNYLHPGKVPIAHIWFCILSLQQGLASCAGR